MHKSTYLAIIAIARTHMSDEQFVSFEKECQKSFLDSSIDETSKELSILFATKKIPACQIVAHEARVTYVTKKLAALREKKDTLFPVPVPSNPAE